MKNEKKLIDSDVLIDYLRGVPKAISFLQHESTESTCYISTITIAELYSGVKEGPERHLLDQFIHEFQIVFINEQIAQQGGLFRRDYGKSHGVGLADAIIAATSTQLDATLVTLNKKHYPMIENIQVPYKKQQ